MGNRGPERNVEAPIEVENPGMNQVRSQRYHEAVLNRLNQANQHYSVYNRNRAQANRVADVRDIITIKNEINLHKKTLQLKESREKPNTYFISFTFDCLCESKITIYYIAREVLSSNNLTVSFSTPKTVPSPAVYQFPEGIRQSFPENYSLFNPREYKKHKLFSFDESYYPIVIKIDKNNKGEGNKEQEISLITYGVFAKERTIYSIKVVRQKLLYGDHVYELHDVFGMDGQNHSMRSSGSNVGSVRGSDQHSNSNNRGESTSNECVICYTNPRNTVILPCRHLCICNECANIVRTQTNKCPLCRTRILSFMKRNNINNEIKKSASEENIIAEQPESQE